MIRALLCIATAAAIAACGQKGPLKLPDQPAPAQPTTPPPAAPPPAAP